MAVFASGIWLLFLGVVAVRFYLGKPSFVTLLEYQQGVLYRKGRPVRDLGPGRIRVWPAIEKVIIVDARTIPIIVENRAVTLVDGMTAVYGLSGSAQVKDAHKALYSAQSFSEVPIFVSLCCSRSVLNACTSSQLMNQRAVEEQISQQAKLKLESQGFGLLTFRLTQLSVAMPSEEPDEDPTETVES